MSTDSAAPASSHVSLPVLGMSCAACARTIELTLADTPGVETADVNFATGRAVVTFDAAQGRRRRPREGGPRRRLRRHRDGRRVRRRDDASAGEAAEAETVEDLEKQAHEASYRDLRRRFAVAVGLTAPLLVVSMGHLHFAGADLLQLALALPVVAYSGAPFYRGAWKSLRHRAADMNTLIAVGTGVAFGYSVVVALAPGWLAGAQPARPARRRRARRLLRGLDGDHRARPARPAARGAGQGAHVGRHPAARSACSRARRACSWTAVEVEIPVAGRRRRPRRRRPARASESRWTARCSTARPPWTSRC